MKHLNVPMKQDLLDRLDKYATESGINKKKIAELAMTEYLNNVVKSENS